VAILNAESLLRPANKMMDSKFKTVRLAAYQGPAEPGALERNAETALRELAVAYRNRADFACMPESFLSGYGAPDDLKAGSCSVSGTWFKKWLRRCNFGDMVAIIGFTEKRGSRYYNSAAVIQHQRLLGVYSKSFCGSSYELALCTFDSKFPVFIANGITFGVIICADSTPIEPSLILAAKGARIIFSPHYNYIDMGGINDHYVRVRNNHVARAVENNCWVVRSNSVTAPLRKMGQYEGFGYGDAVILDNRGAPRAEAGIFTSGWIFANAPRSDLIQKRPSRIASIPKKIRQQVARLYQNGKA
jgi:predicted amidohydrolase